tara:strand:+ start:160 stop:1035 length:876 start_codon:yes stop_codon:yes gene_type:complete
MDQLMGEGNFKDIDSDPFYDYRAAIAAGYLPESGASGEYHWPNQFKKKGHTNQFVDGIDTITGEPVEQPAPVTPTVTPLLPTPPVTPLTAPEPQPAAPPAELQTSFLPDDYIPYEVGSNVWWGDPSPGRLTPAWGAQVVGPYLKSPNWEMFKSSLGKVATAPFESAKGLTYGVNEWIANPLLSFAEAATGEPFSDYHLATEGIFQDRATPVMNPTAYTKDGRKPRVMTKRAMEELYPIFKKSVEAAMVAQGYSQQDLYNAASDITRQTVAKLLSEFEVVDKENFYRALNLE